MTGWYTEHRSQTDYSLFENWGSIDFSCHLGCRSGTYSALKKNRLINICQLELSLEEEKINTLLAIESKESLVVTDCLSGTLSIQIVSVSFRISPLQFLGRLSPSLSNKLAEMVTI